MKFTFQIIPINTEFPKKRKKEKNIQWGNQEGCGESISLPQEPYRPRDSVTFFDYYDLQVWKASIPKNICSN